MLLARPAAAIDEIDAAEEIASLLATPPARDAEEDPSPRRWAVWPQSGYGPATGPEAGVKYEHRNIADSGVTLDVDGVYALNQQQSFDLSVGTPHLLDDRFLVLFST